MNESNVPNNSLQLFVPQNGNRIGPNSIPYTFVDLSNALGTKLGIRFLTWQNSGEWPTESDRVGVGIASGVCKDPSTVTVVRIIRLGPLPSRHDECDGYNIF
jgi:hypothetical protein